MKLQHLIYFRTVGELENYTRAAEALFVSQPNLSRVIQELERELNVALFVRKGRNIKLTNHGKIFLPYVQRILSILDEGTLAVEKYTQEVRKEIVLSALPSLTSFLTEVADQYLSIYECENIRCRIVQDSFDSLREKLLHGHVDFVLGGKIKHSKIGCCKLGTHSLVLIASAENHMAQFESVALSELDQKAFIQYDEQTSLYQRIQGMFREKNICPNVVVETPQDEVIYKFVEADRGIAIVPKPLQDISPALKVLPISDYICRHEIYLNWNKSSEMLPEWKCLQNLIVKTGQNFFETEKMNES